MRSVFESHLADPSETSVKAPAAVWNLPRSKTVPALFDNQCESVNLLSAVSLWNSGIAG